MEKEKPATACIQRKKKENCSSNKPAFFGCYLLRSLCHGFSNTSYIGYTPYPHRRLKQHNGELSFGAARTKNKRPWEMVLFVFGFPSKVSARKFEWAWQHPTRSVVVKNAVACIKPSFGIKRKIKILYTMLTLTEWNSLNLTVNFMSTKHYKHTKACPPLPPQMKVRICSVDELPCYKAVDDSCNEQEKHTKDCPPLPPQMEVQICSVDELPCYKAVDDSCNEQEGMEILSIQKGASVS